MRYAIGMIIIGALLFIMAPLLGQFVIKGITFKADDLFLNTSATFLSIALLALAYKLFGEDQTVKLLKQLINVQKISKIIDDIGVKNYVIARRYFDVKKIEADLWNSETLLIKEKNKGQV